MHFTLLSRLQLQSLAVSRKVHSAACVCSMARSEISLLSLLSRLAEEYRDKCKENPIERWDDLLKVCNCAIVN